jgi:hypothetical protein
MTEIHTMIDLIVTLELLDQLLADYPKLDDLPGEEGLSSS